MQVEIQIQVEIQVGQHGVGAGAGVGRRAHAHGAWEVAQGGDVALAVRACGGAATGLVQGVVRVQRATQVCDARPVGALPVGQPEDIAGGRLQRLAILALGINLGQLDGYGDALRVVAHGLLEDFFGLQVTAIGQIHVGLGHGIHVSAHVELAGRIGHRRCAGGQAAVGRVHMLATTGSEE